MEIGLLIKSKIQDAYVLFHGNVKTLQHTIKEFELVKNPLKSQLNKSQPDYLINISNRDGEKFKIGAAWHREYERNGEFGEMISLSFDDPSFDSPLHVTAFKGDDEHRWPITWRRRNKTTN